MDLPDARLNQILSAGRQFVCKYRRRFFCGAPPKWEIRPARDPGSEPEGECGRVCCASCDARGASSSDCLIDQLKRLPKEWQEELRAMREPIFHPKIAHSSASLAPFSYISAAAALRTPWAVHCDGSSA